MNQTDPVRSARTNRGYIYALVAAAVLATTGILIRYLTLNFQLPSLILAFWRDIIVALTVALGILALRPALFRVERKHWGFLFLYGFCLAIFNSLWTLSVAINGAAIATVLVYCSAAFTALLARWLLKESLGWAKILAVVLCLSGCVLVAGAYDAAAWSANLLGILTGAFSGLMYAIYSLFGRTASQRGINDWTTLLYIFAVGSLFLFLFNTIPGGPLPESARSLKDLLWLGASWQGWTVLVLLAAGPTLAGFALYNRSLAELPSSVANLIVTLEPAFTTVMAYFLFQEIFTPIQWTGSLLIACGVVFLRVYDTIQETRAARATARPAG